MNTSKQVNVMIGLMFVTFAVLGAYFLNESNRAEDANEHVTERIAERGARLFVQNCRTCHGVTGQGSNEGAIAPPLNNRAFLIVTDQNRGELAREFDVGGQLQVTAAGDAQQVHNFLFDTISCGREGTFMPVWSQRFGGTLSETQIDQLVTLITEGRWDLVAHVSEELDEEGGVTHNALFMLSDFGPDPDNPDDEGDREAFDDAFADKSVEQIEEELGVDDAQLLDEVRSLVQANDVASLSITERNCGQFTAQTAGEIRARDPLVLATDGGDGGGDDGGGTPTATAEPDDPVARGEQLSVSQGCTGCHTINGNPSLGPSWLGLFGKTETLEGGATVEVDEAYLHESIVDPMAKVVDGFNPIMPGNFGDTLTDEQISDLIEYIKTLQ